jgi:hypothetical protein
MQPLQRLGVRERRMPICDLHWWMGLDGKPKGRTVILLGHQTVTARRDGNLFAAKAVAELRVGFLRREGQGFLLLGSPPRLHRA